MTLGAGDLNVPRRLCPSCQAGDCDVVDVGAWEAVGLVWCSKEATTQCWGLTGANRVGLCPA
jgi:hypothetical protein